MSLVLTHGRSRVDSSVLFVWGNKSWSNRINHVVVERILRTRCPQNSNCYLEPLAHIWTTQSQSLTFAFKAKSMTMQLFGNKSKTMELMETAVFVLGNATDIRMALHRSFCDDYFQGLLAIRLLPWGDRGGSWREPALPEPNMCWTRTILYKQPTQSLCSLVFPPAAAFILCDDLSKMSVGF